VLGYEARESTQESFLPKELSKEELDDIRYEKRRKLGDDAYFEDDDTAVPAALQVQESATAKSLLEEEEDPEEKFAREMGMRGVKEESSESEDDLDAFMAGIEATVNKEKKGAGKKKDKPKRTEYEDKDDQDTFFAELEKRKEEGGEEEMVEYDENGYEIRKQKKESLDVPIPPLDHTKITYIEINKDFYEEHEDITNMNRQAVDDLRKTLGIKASGVDVPRPVVSFAHFGFDELSMRNIQTLGYTSPTSIQAQAVVAGLSGRDVIGIAKTGSGKTAAFVWPMITHIMDQPELVKGDGPIGIVIAPTRELVLQILAEAKRFGKPFGLQVAAIYGGGNRFEQTKAIKEGVEIAVGVPGRMIDLIKTKDFPMHRVSYLVLDEADRMFGMGFEPQIRSIVSQIRPDCQTMLFSATFQKNIEYLAREILEDPVRVVVGAVGEANTDITQHVKVFGPNDNKWVWLTEGLVGFCSAGSVLIFVTKKANAEMLADNLREHFDPSVLLLHGDMDQSRRNSVIADFKKQKSKMLVATDVAARGLDIPSVRTVVNFDVARDIDTHTHRIGRTGRAGTKGDAHTLLDRTDSGFAGELVRNLEQANQQVTAELLTFANTNDKFKKSRRFGGGGGRGRGGGGGGGKGRGGGRGRRGAGIGSLGYQKAPMSSAQAAEASGGKPVAGIIPQPRPAPMRPPTGPPPPGMAPPIGPPGGIGIRSMAPPAGPPPGYGGGGGAPPSAAVGGAQTAFAAALSSVKEAVKKKSRWD
jgi:ATP-dependent RNA helicase DDX42